MRFFAVTAALAIAGCAAEPGDLNADGRVDCRDLDGRFEAGLVRFTAEHDLGRSVVLDEVQLEFVLYDRIFHSRVVHGGRELRTTGEAFAESARALTVVGPLVPGASFDDDPLLCVYDYDAAHLQLEGEAGYDFPGDGVEGPVDAFVELDARRVSG